MEMLWKGFQKVLCATIYSRCPDAIIVPRFALQVSEFSLWTPFTSMIRGGRALALTRLTEDKSMMLFLFLKFLIKVATFKAASCRNSTTPSANIAAVRKTYNGSDTMHERYVLFATKIGWKQRSMRDVKWFFRSKSSNIPCKQCEWSSSELVKTVIWSRVHSMSLNQEYSTIMRQSVKTQLD